MSTIECNDGKKNKKKTITFKNKMLVATLVNIILDPYLGF